MQFRNKKGMVVTASSKQEAVKMFKAMAIANKDSIKGFILLNKIDKSGTFTDNDGINLRLALASVKRSPFAQLALITLLVDTIVGLSNKPNTDLFDFVESFREDYSKLLKDTKVKGIPLYEWLSELNIEE